VEDIMENKSETDWRRCAQEELRNGELSREAGNEGKARVCARRAAGLIAEEFFNRHGIRIETSSSIVRLHRLKELPQIPAETKQVIEHFLLRTTPDHNLPIDVDLIAEARWLSFQLLGETLG
jgi:hypothetical protein